MAKKADLGSKRLISLAPNNWVRWITKNQTLEVQEILSSEFQWIGRDNDVLLKVTSPDKGTFLILNELQLKYKKAMPLRIRAYTALAEEKYSLPVYPVLINILPNSAQEVIPNFYESEFEGIRSYQNYHVINLWEVEANLVFKQNISSLLPFVPILKGGGNEAIVTNALVELRKNDQLQDLEPLLSFFASFVLEIPIVQKIMRWDMTVLRESPWYQTILQEGLVQGEQLGLQQGEKTEAITLVNRLIKKRFGEVADNLKFQMQDLSVEQLELLGESLFDFNSINDVTNWLDNL
ncbi:Rpn family recombination-promoting nuclease/putative transposase [Geminocystis sp. CENA526]|uniref:Rpn family recombination-promoting nuclease/putative transposase n=1 Tax=Geminocystis sp. CENA526 TaxID=1355871 RepID=UPI003D6F485A